MKPNLVLSVICDYALISSDNKLSVMGIFHEINVRELPAVHPAFFVVLQWLGGIGRHEEKITIVDPRGRELTAHQDQFELKLASQGHVGLIRYSPFRFEFAGEYLIKVELDGEPVRDISFNIVQIKEQ